MDTLFEVIQAELSIKDELESQRLDRLRTVLEPYIYLHLITTTKEVLDAFWATYKPPRKSRCSLVIVERRHHPYFEFILKNIAWAAPWMSVTIFCSDKNRSFIRSILGDKESEYKLITSFCGFGTRQEGKDDYNRLLTNPDFYEMIDSEYMLTVQMDCFFRRKVPEELLQGDFWGNPWVWKLDAAGGGGATIRRVKKMIEICQAEQPEGNFGEDAWLGERVTDFPPLTVRAAFMESLYVKNPILVHQFWTFLDGAKGWDAQHTKEFLNCVLRLDDDSNLGRCGDRS